MDKSLTSLPSSLNCVKYNMFLNHVALPNHGIKYTVQPFSSLPIGMDQDKSMKQYVCVHSISE